MTEPTARPARTWFGPTVLLGLAGAGAAAIAGNNAWAGVSDDPQEGFLVVVTEASAPLVTALALVVLAAWGVVLVTRGRFRWAITWFALFVSVALFAGAIAAWLAAPRAVKDFLAQSGAISAYDGRTAWAVLGVAGSLVSVLAAYVAVRRVRTWPEMGKRYDAVGGDGASRGADDATAPEDRSNLDLWKSMDEGRDPTAGDKPLD